MAVEAPMVQFSTVIRATVLTACLAPSAVRRVLHSPTLYRDVHSLLYWNLPLALFHLFYIALVLSGAIAAPPPHTYQPACEVLHATASDYATSDTLPRALHLWKPKAEEHQRRCLQPIQSGRAFLNRKGTVGKEFSRAPRRDGAAKTVAGLLGWVWVVVDSGCSWHCHYRREDLINLRPCGDTMTGVDGKPQRVTHIGDMPAMARDHAGKLVKILIRDVRLVPTFSDTLISVDQFFEQANPVRTYFNDDRFILIDKGKPEQLQLPFSRRDRLFQWALLPIATLPSNGGGE
jgi:hypothetical protein